MTTLREFDPADREVQHLIAELDAELNERYPDEPTHGIDAAEFRSAKGYLVLLQDETGTAIGCGAFRPIHEDCVEIKRMFVRRTHRGRGYSKTILRHLEKTASQRGYRGLVLETGVRQPEAIALYRSAGYFRIPNFGEFANNPLSVCFAKPTSSLDLAVAN